MLATYARIQSEESQGVNTDLWWAEIKNDIFDLINTASKNDKFGECKLVVSAIEELNADGWFNKHLYMKKFKTEMIKLGYEIDVMEVHEAVLRITIKW